jgi:hypothetical protein
MKSKYFKSSDAVSGFALPTVLISSIVMMMVLLSGLTALASVNTTVRQQYIDQVSDSSAEAGLLFAKECIKNNGNAISWTNSSPLMPNTDCSGTVTTVCAAGSTTSECYVTNTPTVRSSFKVSIVNDTSGNPASLVSEGIVNGVSASSSAVKSQSKTHEKMSVAGLLAAVGAKQHLTSLDITSYGHSYNASVLYDSGTRLCGVTSASEIWCAGTESSMGEFVLNDIGYIGGPTTCYTVTGAITSCSTSSAKLYLSNLSDASSGIFRGKSVQSMISPSASGVTYAIKYGTSSSTQYNWVYSTNLCVITASKDVLCAGARDAEYEDIRYDADMNRAITGWPRDSKPLLTYQGGLSTCYNLTGAIVSCIYSEYAYAHLTNLSDVSIGIFRGKPLKSIIPFRMSGHGIGASDHTVTEEVRRHYGMKMCGITTSNEVWCAGTRQIGQYTADRIFLLNDVGYNGGPTTCRTSAGADIACSDYDAIFYLSNLSDSSTGVFKAKTMTGSNAVSNGGPAPMVY